ncbi:hypothetical protein PoB_001307400 [Plakobranchus ocellatus]|uniref:Reverse transcriptase RNase H-like domain-containing protein n=1 Tax=Plakobranchus ocellatus TaxID=259542 RepID=A0AAV3YWX1_9GAST|nr:hypothetical protein PoB_001307400 [Plakobranchus ocellatus]
MLKCETYLEPSGTPHSRSWSSHGDESFLASGGPDGMTSRVCGPVGEQTCSFGCELKAVTECLRVVIRRQQEGAALHGVVIFTDCRALEQALGGSRKMREKRCCYRTTFRRCKR